MIEVKQKHGVVALLDALGIQNATLDESRTFIEFLEKCKHMTIAFLAGFWSSYIYHEGEPYDKEEVLKQINENPPCMRTFGDTFLVTWEIKHTNILAYVRGIAALVSWTLKNGLENGILFRGAISIGDYLESETTIIGPSIEDVASWHEQADWFGCMTTPYCTRYVKSLFGEPAHEFNLVNYKVPLKNSQTIEAFCANWPLQLNISQDKESIDLLSLYYKAISKLNIPFGTEHKYSNAEAFLKYCIQANLHLDK